MAFTFLLCVFLSGLWYFQLCPLKVVDAVVCCFGDFLYHAVAVLLTSTVAGYLNRPVGCLVVSTPDMVVSFFFLLCWLCLMLVQWLWSISPFFCQLQNDFIFSRRLLSDHYILVNNKCLYRWKLLKKLAKINSDTLWH